MQSCECLRTASAKLLPLMRSTAAMTMPSVASCVLSSMHISSAEPVPCDSIHHSCQYDAKGFMLILLHSEAGQVSAVTILGLRKMSS